MLCGLKTNTTQDTTRLQAAGESRDLPTAALLKVLPGDAGSSGTLSGPVAAQIEGLGAVLANWTLHFVVSPDARQAYLRSIFDALLPGGVLLLTDKTEQARIFTGAHG